MPSSKSMMSEPPESESESRLLRACPVIARKCLHYRQFSIKTLINLSIILFYTARDVLQKLLVAKVFTTTVHPLIFLQIDLKKNEALVVSHSN